LPCAALPPSQMMNGTATAASNIARSNLNLFFMTFLSEFSKIFDRPPAIRPQGDSQTSHLLLSF
jgi:hypothetical protein